MIGLVDRMKKPLIAACFVLALLACIGARISVRTHQGPHFRVLMIGIGKYNAGQDYFPDLDGDQDMAKLKAVIQAQFPNAEIDDSLCANGAATKIAITKAIEALGEKSQPGDAIYIAFAGHGTQVPDSTKSTGRAQAFVPYDVKMVATDDAATGDKAGDVVSTSVISGPEFNGLLTKLRGKVVDANGLANITLTFDCCHSGSISRGGQGQWVRRGRQNPAVNRAGSSTPAAAIKDEPGIKGLICISAAQAGESAWQGTSGGVFTNALVDAFQSFDKDTGSHSYQSLFAQVTKGVLNNALPEQQTPDLLGEPGREIFKSKTLPLVDGYPVVTPVDKSGNISVVIQAGAAYGIHNDDVVGIFKPGTEDPASTPLATGKVSKAGAVSSIITLDGPARSPDEIKALGANIALVMKAAESGRLKIAVSGTLAPDLQRSIAAQPGMELVDAGTKHDVEVDAPPAGGANGPSAAAWTVTYAETPTQSIPAAKFDLQILDTLRSAARLHAVQAFESETRNPDVVVECRLVPITVDTQFNFLALAGPAEIAENAPVNGKVPFLIQVRAFSLDGTSHVKGKFDPYIALINVQPNWQVHEVWPGKDGDAHGVEAEECHLIADDQWRTLALTSGLLKDLSNKTRVAAFGCDERDGLGIESWEIVATPASVDYNPFFASFRSRGGPLQTPTDWSTAVRRVTVIPG
jgi:hypothetical protein